MGGYRNLSVLLHLIFACQSTFVGTDYQEVTAVTVSSEPDKRSGSCFEAFSKFFPTPEIRCELGVEVLLFDEQFVDATGVASGRR